MLLLAIVLRCKSVDPAHNLRMKRFHASYKMWFSQQFYTQIELQKEAFISKIM